MKDGQEFWGSSYLSKEDAKRDAESRLLQSLKSAPVEIRSVETVHDAAVTLYYPTIANRNQRTIDGYWRDTYVRHIKPVLGDMLFDDVRKIHIVNLIQGLRTQKGEPVGYSIKSKCLVVLKAIFTELVENEQLDHIPFGSIDIGKKPGRTPLRVDEAKVQLTMATCPDYMLVPLFLAGVLGMRIGEVMALKWSHIDRASLTLVVESQKSKTGGYKKPKGDKVRTYRITADAIEFLEKHGDLDSVYVCTNPRTGKPWSHSRIGDEWRKLGLEKGVGPHQFRHLFATRAAANNVVAAQQMLGHNDLKTTNGYVHSEVIDTTATVQASTDILKSVARH